MMQKITLKISGMDCAACAAVIEHELKKENGIKSVNVNYAAGKAYLEYDQTIISLGKIIELVKKAGYNTEEETLEMEMASGHDHHKIEKEIEIKKLKRRFVLGFIFGLPIIYMVMGKIVGLPIPMFLENYGIPI